MRPARRTAPLLTISAGAVIFIVGIVVLLAPVSYGNGFSCGAPAVPGDATGQCPHILPALLALGQAFLGISFVTIIGGLIWFVRSRRFVNTAVDGSDQVNSVAGQLAELSRLHLEGELTESEFGHAKALLLAGPL